MYSNGTLPLGVPLDARCVYILRGGGLNATAAPGYCTDSRAADELFLFCIEHSKALFICSIFFHYETQTVSKRVVGVLLECFLVLYLFGVLNIEIHKCFSAHIKC